MPSLRLATLLAIVLSLFINISLQQQTDDTMATAGKPWADEPMKLVATPQFETKKNDIFTVGASHMALLHNSIIRSFNSIYLQAPHIQEADKADFIGYCLTWFRFVKSHHDDEEENLFPKVSELLGDDKVWSETHEEHESFLGGLGEFNTYLSNLASPSAFSGSELIRIMDSFKEPFEHHFHSEISTIAAMDNHEKAPKRGTPEGETVAATFKAWGKQTVSKAGKLDVVPFFLLNHDGTAEEGMWANWPPMPAPIRWGLVNLAGSWHGSWWKFASCDAQGEPQVLYALRNASDEKKEEL